MVDSAGEAQLKVTWKGGLGAETYTKAEGGTASHGAADDRSGFVTFLTGPRRGAGVAAPRAMR